MNPYVWFQGKCWRGTGLKDHRGYTELVDLKDSSLGVMADPAKTRPCSDVEAESIEYFLRGEPKP